MLETVFSVLVALALYDALKSAYLGIRALNEAAHAADAEAETWQHEGLDCASCPEPASECRHCDLRLRRVAL